MMEANLRTGSLLMSIAAVGFVGYAGIFLMMNFTDNFLELGIGPNEVDKSRADIQAFSPDLYEYISHLHVAVAGFIAAMGVAVFALSWFGVRRGMTWAWTSAVSASALGLVIALPLHYVYGLATLGHLGLVYLAALIFVVGACQAGLGLRSAHHPASISGSSGGN